MNSPRVGARALNKLTMILYVDNHIDVQQPHGKELLSHGSPLHFTALSHFKDQSELHDVLPSVTWSCRHVTQ